MDLYFGQSAENKIILDKDESNHLLNAKRTRVGDSVQVTDGEGNLYNTILLQSTKGICELGIEEKISFKKNPYSLHISISPTKNIDRIEWFLEKATETGIDEITFLTCRNSERKEIKADRLTRVLISSVKQSMKTFLPKINVMTDFKIFVKGNFQADKIICTMDASEEKNLKKNYSRGNNLLALIGPEGDFHADEIALAVQNGFVPLSLGSSRLRTETAALNVCTIFNFINSN